MSNYFYLKELYLNPVLKEFMTSDLKAGLVQETSLEKNEVQTKVIKGEADGEFLLRWSAKKR